MKILKILFGVALVFALSVVFLPDMAFGQVPSVDTSGIAKGPFPDGSVSLPDMLTWYEILYGALVIIWGYVAKGFNLKNDKVPFVFVVLAGGLVLAVAFIVGGFSNVFPLLFSFLSSIGVYDLIFKPASQLVTPKQA